jgi:molybdate transport system substrate-binding protein
MIRRLLEFAANHVRARQEETMRTTFTTIALALTLSAGAAAAAEIRVLCVGSTQVAAKALAADFTKQNGRTVTVTATAPFNIDKELTAKPFDLLIISMPAVEAYDEAGSLRPGTRTALARVGVGLVVKQGATVPDISTPEAFKKAVLAAKSITHSDPAVPNLAGAVAAAAFAKAGILDEVKAKTRYAGLAAGGELVAKGEIEMGFFNLSEIPPGLTVAGPVPASLRSYTFYEAGVLAKGAAHEPASAFVKFMASAGAGKVWRDAGLEPAADYQPTRASTN